MRKLGIKIRKMEEVRKKGGDGYERQRGEWRGEKGQ